MSISQAAARALEDPEFAQKVLTGEEDYPEVRDAILADLFESSTQVTSGVGVRETEGSSGEAKLETRFVDAGPRFGPMGPCYVKYYPKMPAADAWKKWIVLPRLNLQRIARIRMATSEAAARALKEPEFAQKVLTGEEDYPEVRDAILADLFESTHVTTRPHETEGSSAEASLETRFVDAGPRFGPMGPCYVKYYPKMPAADAWKKWIVLPRVNLERIASTGRD